jgi:nucleotide-binding universal stress UspA family protein
VAAPVIAALDPATEDMAPVRFGEAVAGHLGVPLYVAAVYANDEIADRLAAGQLGEELRREPGELLDRIVGELRHEGIDAEALPLAATSVPRGLELAAQQLGAGLIAAGSAADSDPEHLTPGRATERLLTGSGCAVAAVPWGWDHLRRPPVIGIAYVDTAEGRAALRAAHVLADLSGGRLRVLAAVRARTWMGDPSGDEPLGADLRARAEQAAAAAASGLLGEPVDVDVAVAEPADFLLEVSEELDVLVCGARGYGPAPAVLLGGVTERVVHGAACPVMVLARGPDGVPWAA